MLHAELEAYELYEVYSSRKGEEVILLKIGSISFYLCVNEALTYIGDPMSCHGNAVLLQRRGRVAWAGTEAPRAVL